MRGFWPHYYWLSTVSSFDVVAPYPGKIYLSICRTRNYFISILQLKTCITVGTPYLAIPLVPALFLVFGQNFLSHAALWTPIKWNHFGSIWEHSGTISIGVKSILVAFLILFEHLGALWKHSGSDLRGCQYHLFNIKYVNNMISIIMN